MQLFQEAVERVVVEVEDQNLDGLQSMLHDSFMDQQDRDREQFLAWLKGLMKQRKDIVVNLLDMDEVTPPSADEAGEISLDVVVSSGNLKLVRKLVGFYGRLVRITLFVVNDEPWRISSAEWREIDLADLSVMAVDEFKKLFPDGG